MDEVQLEDSYFWHLFDSSQQLVIDCATKSTHKKIIILISFYSIIIILASIFAPKSYKAKFIEAPLINPHELNFMSTIDTHGLQLYNRTVTVFFSIQRQAHIYNSTNMRGRYGKHHRKFHFDHEYAMKRYFQIKSKIRYFSNNAQTKNYSIVLPKVSLPFSHHHVISDTVKLFDFSGQNADLISIDFTVTGNFHHFHSIWYLISVNNPFYRIFNQYACYFFAFLSSVFIIYLLFTCKKRYEQVMTSIYFILSLATSFSYIFSYNLAWQILPKITILYFQLYMFYMVAYVANKQRSIITSLSMILFVVSFISDMLSLFLKRNVQNAFISHGHNFLWHHITIAVSLSTIAAMRSSIDDFAAFTIYTTCLCISMFSSWTALDLTFFFPRLHLYFNLEVMSLGMNSIVMCILFAYHRTFNPGSRRDQKSNSVSMKEKL